MSKYKTFGTPVDFLGPLEGVAQRAGSYRFLSCRSGTWIYCFGRWTSILRKFHRMKVVGNKKLYQKTQFYFSLRRKNEFELPTSRARNEKFKFKIRINREVLIINTIRSD